MCCGGWLAYVACDCGRFVVNSVDVQSHAAGRAFDHPHGVLDVAGIEIGHLHLDDVFDLGLRSPLPTFSLFGTPEPLAMPAAFLSSAAAGGLLVTKSNERSL